MQTIYLDISNRGVVPTICAKQGDVGRKFLSIITDSGIPYNPSEETYFTIWYEGSSGSGNYSEIDGNPAATATENKVVVELIAQMMLIPGSGIISMTMNDAGGNQIGLWNIPYFVESVVGIDSVEATAHYTALSEVASQAIGAASEAKKAAEDAKKAAGESGGYYTPSILENAESISIFFDGSKDTMPAVPSIELEAIRLAREYNSGVWRVREWSNGECELWGTFTGAGSAVAWGSLYAVADIIPQQTYPVTFANAPYVQYSSHWVSGNTHWLYASDKAGTTTKTPSLSAAEVSKQNVTAKVTFYVKGILA
jgi:hypothetical protein